MITNAEVFTEGHVPGDMVHRHAELQMLSRALEPLLEGGPTKPAVIHGPSGAGKSSTALYLCSKLRERRLDIATTRVNCWGNRSRFDVLYRALDAVGRTVDIHHSSTSTTVLLDRLREATEDAPMVLVLDEVDQLRDRDVLYDLATTSNLGLVLIAHSEEEIFAPLSSRCASRVRGGASIEMTSYGIDELTDILSGRVEAGLARGVVTERQLREIADRSGGNAHDAISTLYYAVREAEQRGLEEVTDAVIEPATNIARRRRRETHLGKLGEHQRALFDIVSEEGEIAPADLYEAYEERVDDAVSERMVRNHLSKLAHYDLVEVEGSTSDRVYRAVEKTEAADKPTA